MFDIFIVLLGNEMALVLDELNTIEYEKIREPNL